MHNSIPNTIAGEQVANLGEGDKVFVAQSTDPNIFPQPYVTPVDFAAQYPTPLNTDEIIAMCEELSVWEVIPEERTALKQETWRELNSLAFTSGSSYISFADGECPEEYTHDGTNTTITLKNIGAKKSLAESDIMHSTAVAAANWNGINRLIGAAPAHEGMPGTSGANSFVQEAVADLKEKEIRLQSTLVMNGWDRLLVEGNSGSNSLEFDGIEQLVTSGNGSYTDTSTASGTYSSTAYDRFLSAGCVKPTHIFGHPQSIQEMLSGYFQLGYQGSQLVNFNTGNRITPGFNFAGFVNTGVGRLAVVADKNFNISNSGASNFQGELFSLRMTHNGVPFVYKLTQIPLSLKDLVPGCTAISFQVWAKTALVVKHKCAHGRYTTNFSGSSVTTCPTIG